MQPTTAATLTNMMVQVVERGTGTAAQIDGVDGGGQDGYRGDQPTARRRTRGSSPSRPADAPRYAVAVIVEHGGNSGSEATGGAVAAPIAQADAPEPVWPRTRE